MVPIVGDIFHLVAGARLSNYMQIEIEPFPLQIYMGSSAERVMSSFNQSETGAAI